MTDPADLTATAARRAIAAGTLTPAALQEACRARIAQREPVVQAFATLAPAGLHQDGLHQNKLHLDGPLAGLPIGVKDVLDTADLPTAYNSPIWAGHRPRADAACVAWARAAGAVVMGKTVTTEFATRTPGPTTNPHNLAHTPGGSSSGSAAAVAAGMVPLAFGTQTAGSVIRPAAYCGVVGYKPSLGLIDRHGMKLMSVSLDTIGVLARSVADCALLASVVSGADLGDPDCRPPRPPRIGLCRTELWHRAEPATVALFDGLADRLRAAGATVTDWELPGTDEAEHTHGVLMNAESARAMGWELTRHRTQISPALLERLEYGLAQPYAAVISARTAQRTLQAQFAAAMTLDCLITPAAPGEAPAGLAYTGDACFNFLWTFLGVPCVSVPAGVGPGGLPLGVQIVGRRDDDAAALAWAAWVQAAL